jgi:hypothetical protein
LPIWVCIHLIFFLLPTIPIDKALEAQSGRLYSKWLNTRKIGKDEMSKVAMINTFVNLPDWEGGVHRPVVSE